MGKKKKKRSGFEMTTDFPLCCLFVMTLDSSLNSLSLFPHPQNEGSSIFLPIWKCCYRDYICLSKCFSDCRGLYKFPSISTRAYMLIDKTRHKGKYVCVYGRGYFSDHLHGNFPHKKMTSILIKVSWTEYTDFLKSLGDGYFPR